MIDGHCSMFGSYENDADKCIVTIFKDKTIIHEMFRYNKSQKRINQHLDNRLQKTLDVLSNLVQEDSVLVVASCDYHGELLCEKLQEFYQRVKIVQTTRSGQMGIYEAVFNII